MDTDGIVGIAVAPLRRRFGSWFDMVVFAGDLMPTAASTNRMGFITLIQRQAVAYVVFRHACRNPDVDVVFCWMDAQ